MSSNSAMIPVPLEFEVARRSGSLELECAATFASGVTAVFGPSGSGKSTLLNCIAGVMTPDEGRVEILGRVVFSSAARTNLRPESRRLGYMLQEAALFPHMSVRENILYGYRLTPAERRRIHPDELVDLFRIGSLMERSVANLSRGEGQRVALARALATSPDLLLLDEPTAALDAVMRGTILEFLLRCWRELGTPMVYVSHSLSEVLAIADEVLVLADGRRVAYGKAADVLVHPDVPKMAEYAALENILEAQVIAAGGPTGMSELALGKVVLFGPRIDREPGSSVMISVRAGEIIVALEAPPRLSARNVVRAVVKEVHEVASGVILYVDVGVRLVVEITYGSSKELGLGRGREVYLILKASSIMVLDALVGRGG